LGGQGFGRGSRCAYLPVRVLRDGEEERNRESGEEMGEEAGGFLCALRCGKGKKHPETTQADPVQYASRSRLL